MKDVTARLEARIAKLEDQRAIEAVLINFARAMDWLDDALLDEVVFDDAEMDYGFYKGDGRGFKVAVMEVERSVGRRWHFSSQIEIDIDGDQARSSSYQLSMGLPTTQPEPPADFTAFVGHYFDRLERRNGRWGIVARKHVLLTAATMPEIRLDGPFASLNRIGATSPVHPDYPGKAG